MASHLIFSVGKKVIKMNRKFDGVLLEKVAQRKNQGKKGRISILLKEGMSTELVEENQ